MINRSNCVYSYPPTPAHLAVLLSLFHCPEASDVPFVDSKAVLATFPTAIILHELSSYFLDEASDHTCVAYLLGDAAAHLL